MSVGSTCFEVLLEDGLAGGVDFKFCTTATNHSREEQLQSLIDRNIGASLVVLGDMRQVIHGTLSVGGSPATLLVMRFEFQPAKNHRRFKSVVVKMTFSKGSNAVAGPEVYRIAPDGAWSLLPSRIPVETSHTVGPSLQGGGMGPATGTIGYQWQSKKTVNEENTARITGTVRALGPDKSRKNTATWTLLENPDTDSGIPTLLETAILLKRDNETLKAGDGVGGKFKATLEIYGETDMVTSWEDRIQSVTKLLRGRAERGEDVIFNPALSRGSVKDPENLRDVDLEMLSKVETLKDVARLQEKREEVQSSK